MRGKFINLLQNVRRSMADPSKKRSWQSGIGITIFTLFVLSSFIVSQNVQALNRAAGSYGYYGGTYGYNATDASSDAVPNPPTSLSTSVTTSSVTFSWIAPTTTVDSTALNNLTGYCYSTGSSSETTCTLSSSTTTSTSVTISGLACGATRYIAVRAYDAGTNLSTALTGSATSTACGGGVAGGGGGGGVTGPTYPTATTTTTTPVAAVSTTVAADAAQLVAQLGVTRDTALETSYATKVSDSASEFSVTVGATDAAIATNFVVYGTGNSAVTKLGSGERLALVRDQLATLGRVSLVALEQLANGQKPTVRNLPNEVKQLPIAVYAYEKLVGHRPNFQNAIEDLAWNTLMYRVRFTRDLNKERAGISKFRSIYKKTPSSPFDWAVVRAWGYQLVNL